ncbi:MAG: helix-turn-helix domain-containing protein [Rikenellaceae bacterium]
MGEIITKQSERVTRFLSSLDRMMDGLDKLAKSHTPRLDGEVYLTDSELSEQLRISDRTLQEWRNSGKIDFIQFEKKGKVLYRESDVKKLLLKHYHKAWG